MSTSSTPTSEPIVESCLFCNVKVRIQADKVLAARCPKCKGPIGDPKMDQACPACQAVNRVFRSRLGAARCGKCKTPLFDGPLPNELVLADLYAVIGGIFADPRLAGRRIRPRDLVEALDLLAEMPQAIANIAVNMDPGPDRDKLGQLGQRIKALPAKVRPLAFPDSAILHTPETVEKYMLEDAFEVLRVHPAGFDFLAKVKRSDPGATSAREEMGVARKPFDRIVSRMHKANWQNETEDRQRRTELAERIFNEFSRVLETWLLRPYKLDATVRSAMARLGELPEGPDAFVAHETVIRDELAVFMAMTTSGIARGVAFHLLAPDPKEAWWRLQSVLRASLID